jgi:hypothetical protein
MSKKVAEFPFYRDAEEINAQSAVLKMCVVWPRETMASAQRTVPQFAVIREKAKYVHTWPICRINRR